MKRRKGGSATTDLRSFLERTAAKKDKLSQVFLQLSMKASCKWWFFKNTVVVGQLFKMVN